MPHERQDLFLLPNRKLFAPRRDGRQDARNAATMLHKGCTSRAKAAVLSDSLINVCTLTDIVASIAQQQHVYASHFEERLLEPKKRLPAENGFNLRDMPVPSVLSARLIKLLLF
jgi:hypothetical protein